MKQNVIIMERLWSIYFIVVGILHVFKLASFSGFSLGLVIFALAFYTLIKTFIDKD